MPNPNPPVPPRIEDIEAHLNSTKNEHNGADYAEFVKRVNLCEPKAVIARAFNVQPATIRFWLQLYDGQRKKQVKAKGKGG